jgi:hypothetical protein
MAVKDDSWESELWSYLSTGDGVHCPLYEACELRLQGVWCLSDNEEYYQRKTELLDNDNPDLETGIEFKFFGCPRSSRIFRLVSSLAEKYQAEAGINRPPVPDNLITKASDGLPIEVRKVPLKVHHGAVWRLDDQWIIQLNNHQTEVHSISRDFPCLGTRESQSCF